MSSWMEFAEYADMFTRCNAHYCNEHCLSFDGSKSCVTTGFWLIIMSSDIAIAPKSSLYNGEVSVNSYCIGHPENYREVIQRGQIFALLWVL